jgi:hypothetical protein
MPEIKSTVEKSRKKTGGRTKGTPNKLTKDVIDRLKELKCDPIEGMAKIAAQAMTEGELMLAGQMYKELAQYVAPKRKAVEHTGLDGGPIETRSKVLTVVGIESTNPDTE